MAVMKSIAIVGGGLAGLTLGIGLRQRGVPAALWEAGRYPRHRVCGEFICGRGHGGLLFRNPIHPAAAAAFAGHLPFAFHPGRHTGGKIPRTRRRIVGRQTPERRRRRRRRRSCHGPLLADGGGRCALVWIESTRAQYSAHGRPRNARFIPGLCRFMPGQWRQGERLRIVPPPPRRKCRAAKPARMVARTNRFAVAPAAGFGGI